MVDALAWVRVVCADTLATVVHVKLFGLNVAAHGELVSQCGRDVFGRISIGLAELFC